MQEGEGVLPNDHQFLWKREENIVCFKQSREKESLGLYSSCEDFTSLSKNGR